MGLINKLKNVLFEEEEIEIPEKEVEKKEVVKESTRKKETVKMTFDSDDDILSDRELFKAEPTFNFPMFDEQEFENVNKVEKKVSTSIEEPKKEVKSRTRASVSEDVLLGRSRTAPQKKIETPVYDYKEKRKERDNQKKDNHKFTPSPVISPVYGVLDKNYKKEDIVISVDDKKVIDVDSVRKKAFGTLEDDIEKTLNTPVKEFYKREVKEDKSLDELLKTSAEEIIPVVPKDDTIMDFPSFNIEEEPMESRVKKELDILDQPKEKSVQEKLEDETLENDLFDLIDSMYESREDGES